MTKSQNTKNEQLTEQWKKEHSIKENQHYYIKDTRDNIYIDYFWGDGWLDNSNEDITEVLAPVPTFEECQAKLEENAQLKELLKEVLRHELSLKEISELSRKISEVIK